MKSARIRIRKAESADVGRMRELIECSVRELQAADYTPAQMEAALEKVVGVDSQLIADGTYFVAEVRTSSAHPEAGQPSGRKDSGVGWVLAGCGGWSKRKTLFGGDHWSGRENALVDPKHDAAKIRAFFVHPAWARRGIGSKILEACEIAASTAGFTSFELGATLTGAKLFKERGYVEAEKIEVAVKNGISLPVIRMVKRP
jgi:N-acetylglutamate synthase-like GNAT family acetyltransferase